MARITACLFAALAASATATIVQFGKRSSRLTQGLGILPARVYWRSRLTRGLGWAGLDVSVQAGDKSFQVEVTEDWAPLGAAQFIKLVEAKHYDGPPAARPAWPCLS